MSPLLDTLQILYLLKQERLYQALVAKSVILVRGRQTEADLWVQGQKTLPQANKQTKIPNKTKKQAHLQDNHRDYVRVKLCQALCVQKVYWDLITPLYVFCGMSYENISAIKCVALAHWVLSRKKNVLSRGICTPWLAGAAALTGRVQQCVLKL